MGDGKQVSVFDAAMAAWTQGANGHATRSRALKTRLLQRGFAARLCSTRPKKAQSRGTL